jgi:hypothetical protein
LYKLYGSIDRPDTLTLTEDEYNAFGDNSTLATVLQVVRGHLATKTIVFLGYDLADSHFQQLFQKVVAPIKSAATTAYAVVECPLDRVTAGWCKRRHIQTIQGDAQSFLHVLSDQLSRHQQQTVSPYAPISFQRRLARLRNLLRLSGWLRDVNFGGSTNPQAGEPDPIAFLSVVAGGFYVVPPQGDPFPGASIF